MRKQRVALLRGGPSEEHEVSMKTGAAVLAALDRLGVPYVDIVINRQGEWLVGGVARSPIDALLAVDVAFIALHGKFGEDGSVQRLLENLGVPYIGSRPYPSAVAMNKILTKETLMPFGIKMPAHLRVTRSGTDLRRVVATIESLFGPTYIVKPINGGSSIDAYQAKGAHELYEILTRTLDAREEVMVEEFIKGREATVGLVEGLRGSEFYRLPAVEIVPPPTHDFFSAEIKYNGATDEICPGRFSRQEKEELESLAEKVHRGLGLSHYSRSDFIVNEKGVYFLETNTLPGLTTESLFPKALNAVGHGFDEFIYHLIGLAIRS